MSRALPLSAPFSAAWLAAALLPACNPRPSQPATPAAPVAVVARESGAAAANGQAPASPTSALTVRTLADLPWGSGPAQVGRVLGGDQNPEGPMSLDAAADGSVWLLDQVNSRVVQVRAGQAERTVTVSRTAHDLLLYGGQAWLLDRLVRREAVLADLRDGRVRTTVPLVTTALRQAGLEEPGVLSALLQADGAVWAEVAHGTAVRLAALDGTPQPTEARQGRPVASGRDTLRAQRLPPSAVVVTRWSPGQAAPMLTLRADFALPVHEIHELASDREGRIWMVAELASDGGDVRQRVAVVWSADGREWARAPLCATQGPEETLRVARLGDNGHLYNACVHAGGVRIQEVSP